MTTEESSKFAIDELDDSLSEDTEEDRLKLLEAEDVYHAIIQASDLIWTFEFREAEFLLAPFKDNISVLMQLAEIQAWKSSLDETDENHQLALDKMISLEAIAEATFNKYQPQSVAVQKISSFFRSFMKKDEAPPPPVDPEVLKINKRRQLEALSVLADTSGALAMLHLRKQGFVRAANYVRKAWKHYKDAENILLHDDHVKGDFLLTERGKNIASRVQFGYGLFNYVISMLPVALKWIVEAIGFQGDRDKAIADLEACSKLVPSPRSTWASILLVGMRWFFNDEEEGGLRLGHELLEKYPTSPLLKTTMANLYRRRADLEKSNLYFQQSIEAASAFPQFKLTAEYELGHNFFLANRWHDAIPPIEEYLAKSFSKNFKAFGSYKLGICYWILSVEAEKEDPPNKERAQELRSKIEKLYREIPKHVRSNMSYDKYAEKRAALYFKQNGWSELDIFFVSIDNMLEIKKFEEATALLDQSIPLVKASHPENYAHWVYLKGLSLKKQHMHEKAKNYFQKVLSLRANITHDTWIIPYSAVELAEVFLAEKNIKMANTAIDVAKSFPSGYDFEKHCSMKIKKAAGKIAKLPSTPAAADSSSSSSSSAPAPST